MNYLNKFFVLNIVWLLATSCSQPKEARTPVPPKELREMLIQNNMASLKVEQEKIDTFIKENGWDPVRTKSGLYYNIYHRGDGDSAKNGMVAFVNFSITLLDGTFCYGNEGKQPVNFLIGMDDIESGVHEAVTFLRVGDKIKVVMPSVRAHGLLGDRHKIPPRSPIVYDLELVKVQPH